MGDSFDLASFEDEMTEAYNRLEELHAIDAILDGIESRGLGDLYIPPGQGNFGNDYNTTIELGTYHPFVERVRAVNVSTQQGYPFSSPPTTTYSDVDFGFVDDAYEDAASWREGAEADARDAAEYMTRIEPGELRAPAHVLAAAYVPLKTLVQANWDGLDNQAGEWEGRAALDYFDNFSDPVDQIRQNHCWAIDFLVALIGATKAVNDAGQHSIMNLATGLREYADGQLLERAARNAPEVEDLVLLSTGAGIVGALAFPAPGAAAVLGGLSYVLNYAATEVPASVQRAHSMAAESATGMHSSMIDELDQVKAAVVSQLDGVGEKVKDMRTHINEMKQRIVGDSPANLWTPISVDIDEAPDNGWYHESSQQGL